MSKTRSQLLADLLRKVGTSDAGSPDLDAEIWCVVNGVRYVEGFEHHFGTRARYIKAGTSTQEETLPGQVRPWTRSLDAARDFVDRYLPNFFVTSGLCELSGHATIGPDYNGAHGDRLKREWPEDDYHSGFSADLEPGGERHAECLAIIHCALQALIAREKLDAVAA